MTGLTVGISLIWLTSWMLGLTLTLMLATLLVIPYAGITAYLAWQQVRVR